MSTYLLPSEDFISLYDYQDGDYFYYENYKLFRGYHQESILLYINYNKNNYLLAKEYIDRNIALDYENTLSYNSYLCEFNCSKDTFGKI